MSEQNHLELGRVILDFPIQAYTIKSLYVHEEANAHGSLTLLLLPKGLSLSRTVSAMRTPPSVSWMIRVIPSSAAPAPLSARIT